MGASSIWTREEAEDMLAKWKEAARALASGQAQEYTVGTRKVTLIDMNAIHKQIQYFTDVLDVLKGRASTRMARTVVPRDL